METKGESDFSSPQVRPKAESRRKHMGEALFVRECRKALCNLLGSSDLSRPRKELYRELVMGSASDPLSERHWNWAPGSSFLNNSEFSLTWRLARNALPLLGLNYEAGLEDILTVLAAAMEWKKRLSTPSTIASEFARFGITSGSGRLASNPSSSYCSTLVTS